MSHLRIAALWLDKDGVIQNLAADLLDFIKVIMNVLTTIQDKNLWMDARDCKYQTLLCLRLFPNAMLIKLDDHVDRFRQESRLWQVVRALVLLRSLNLW